MKKEKFQIYGMHLMYLDAKRHYTGLETPGKFYDSLFAPERKQKPDKDIIPGVLQMLGGGKG